MYYNFINKSAHVLLLLIFVSHLTFFHNLLDDYVLCIGNDGHITIENIKECDECREVNINGESNSVELNSQDCNDIALNQSCFETVEFFPRDKIVVTANVVKLVTILDNSQSEKGFNYSYNNHDFKNSILERYTSVSLLI